MKKEIIELSKNCGIDVIGFSKLRNYEELLEKYLIQQQLEFKSEFQVGNICDKVNVKDKYPNFNTIIAFGVSFQLSNNILKDENIAYLSSSSWGKDYHNVLREKAATICEYLYNKNYKTKVFVDNNELDERYLAYQSGLGFYGKNNLLINDEIGTNFFIGIILTDAIFEYDTPLKKTCLSCNKCIDECPNNALTSNGLNSNKCLSYITQKKNLTKEEEKLINKFIYGCDICTNICPHNINIQNNTNFLPSGIEFIKLDEYKHLSNRLWRKKYGDLSCAWRGRNVFERNINIVKEKLEKK